MDNNEEGKRNSTKAPPRLDEPDPDPDLDLSLAMSVQGRQDGEHPPFPTIESQSEDEEIEDDDDDYEYDAEDYEYFSSRGIDGEFGLLQESEDMDGSFYFGMDDDDEGEEDEIDPDDLSYEQLLELGEIIGEEKRGLTVDQISCCLQPIAYKSAGIGGVGVDRCVVCQAEFGEGEKLVALSCEHPYHSECVGRWLQVKKTCPICGTEASASSKS